MNDFWSWRHPSGKSVSVLILNFFLSDVSLNENVSRADTNCCLTSSLNPCKVSTIPALIYSSRLLAVLLWHITQVNSRDYLSQVTFCCISIKCNSSAREWVICNLRYAKKDYILMTREGLKLNTWGDGNVVCKFSRVAINLFVICIYIQKLPLITECSVTTTIASISKTT